jgi:hypothetical protein
MSRIASLIAALCMALAPSFAFAQAVESTAPTLIINPSVKGHANVYLDPGQTAPTVSACGTSTVSAGSSDTAGRVVITAGTPTSCKLTFGTAWKTAPACVWSTSAGTNLTTAVTTTTDSTVTIAAGANATLLYICVGLGL